MSNDLSQTLITLAGGFVTVVALMTATMIVSIRARRLSLVDTVWGLGFVLVSAVSAALAFGGEGHSLLRWVLLAMTAVWGARLAWHVGTRNHGKPEDPRYADIVERSGGSIARAALTKVFPAQALGMWVVAAPLMVGVNNRSVHVWLLVLGVVVWAVGLFFETVGDRQLVVYKSDPANKGKIMDTGLWKYTRHPNYFGDACVWWGIGLVAAGSWAGVVALIGPLFMTVSLTEITGAKLNEKGQRSKPGWDDYVRRTSYFVPLPPK
ncbi:MAG: hypothetical protein JWP10_1323 [Nocardioidaceae bacterium]|nr:hypothetical protein [Nocardioidaceae bacterium]